MATIVQEGQGLLALQFPDDDGPQEAVQGRLGQWSDELTRLKLEAIRAARRAAIALTEWHKAETRRVYAMLDGREEDDEQAELLRWIKKRGGEVSVREIAGTGLWRLRGRTQEIEAALSKAVSDGRGEWVVISTSPSGGRPKRVFRLKDRTT